MRMLLEAVTDLIKNEKSNVSLLCPVCLEFVPLSRWGLDVTEDWKARPVFTKGKFEYQHEATTRKNYKLWHPKGIAKCEVTSDARIIWALEEYFVYIVRKNNGPAAEMALVIGKRATKLYKNAEELFVELKRYGRKYGLYYDITEVL